MKKIILSVVFIAVGFTSIAQVGIGTTNPEGALDIVSSNSGLILPRVANTAAVTTPINGMIIYDISSTCIKAYQQNHWTGCLLGSDTPPVASAVSVGGNLGIGAILTGLYTYSDADGHAEGTSTFQWYRADDASGTNQIAISGATVNTYTLISADESKYIAFQVTPVASSGTSNVGSTVLSSYRGPATIRDIETVVQDIVLPTSGQTWMDRNLGATAAATVPDSTDPTTFGDLYQWGRHKDGHEDTSNASTTTVQATGSDASNGGVFITNTSNWTSFTGNNLWADSVNDPCPSGYRVPTKLELDVVFGDFSTSQEYRLLNIPLTGYRDFADGDIKAVNVAGYLWSTEINGNDAPFFYVQLNTAGLTSGPRSFGFSVRCIKQ
jgi:hypothetical protein